MTGHKNQGERPINVAALVMGLLGLAAALLIASAAAVGAETPRPTVCPAQVESPEVAEGETLRGIADEDVVETLSTGEVQLALYGNGLVCAPAVDHDAKRDEAEQVTVDVDVEAPVEVEVEEQQEVALAFTAPAEPSAEVVEPADVVVEPVAEPTIQARASVVAASSLDEYASEMLRLINVERAEVGLPALTPNTDLDQYAQQWAQEMSNQPLPLDRARHHSPRFSGSSVTFREFPSTVQWTHAFENVGRLASASGQIPADAIARLFYADGGAGFTTSPTHYCNIIETAATEVGVGTYIDSSGALWVAQVFWGTHSPAPDPLASCASTVAR